MHLLKAEVLAVTCKWPKKTIKLLPKLMCTSIRSNFSILFQEKIFRYQLRFAKKKKRKCAGKQKVPHAINLLNLVEKSIYSSFLRLLGPHKSVPQDRHDRGHYVKIIYACGHSVPSVSHLSSVSFASFIGHVLPPSPWLPSLSWSAPCVPHVGL